MLTIMTMLTTPTILNMPIKLTMLIKLCLWCWLCWLWPGESWQKVGQFVSLGWPIIPMARRSWCLPFQSGSTFQRDIEILLACPIFDVASTQLSYLSVLFKYVAPQNWSIAQPKYPTKVSPYPHRYLPPTITCPPAVTGGLVGASKVATMVNLLVFVFWDAGISLPIRNTRFPVESHLPPRFLRGKSKMLLKPTWKIKLGAIGSIRRRPERAVQ